MNLTFIKSALFLLVAAFPLQSYAAMSDLLKSSDLEESYATQDSRHSEYRNKELGYKKMVFEKSKIFRCDADTTLYLFYYADNKNKSLNLHYFSLSDAHPNLILGLNRADYEQHFLLDTNAPAKSSGKVIDKPPVKLTDKSLVFETVMFRDRVAPVDRGIRVRTVLNDGKQKLFWIDNTGHADIARQLNTNTSTLYSRVEEYGQDHIYKTNCRVLKE